MPNKFEIYKMFSAITIENEYFSSLLASINKICDLHINEWIYTIENEINDLNSLREKQGLIQHQLNSVNNNPKLSTDSQTNQYKKKLTRLNKTIKEFENATRIKIQMLKLFNKTHDIFSLTLEDLQRRFKGLEIFYRENFQKLMQEEINGEANDGSHEVFYKHCLAWHNCFKEAQLVFLQMLDELSILHVEHYVFENKNHIGNMLLRAQSLYNDMSYYFFVKKKFSLTESHAFPDFYAGNLKYDAKVELCINDIIHILKNMLALPHPMLRLEFLNLRVNDERTEDLTSIEKLNQLDRDILEYKQELNQFKFKVIDKFKLIFSKYSVLELSAFIDNTMVSFNAYRKKDNSTNSHHCTNLFLFKPKKQEAVILTTAIPNLLKG